MMYRYSIPMSDTATGRHGPTRWNPIRSGQVRIGDISTRTRHGYSTTRGYRLCGHTESLAVMFKYARKNINKWLNNNIQLHFIMKQFSMTQLRVLCPHKLNHLRELSSFPRHGPFGIEQYRPLPCPSPSPTRPVQTSSVNVCSIYKTHWNCRLLTTESPSDLLLRDLCAIRLPLASRYRAL